MSVDDRVVWLVLSVGVDDRVVWLVLSVGVDDRVVWLLLSVGVDDRVVWLVLSVGVDDRVKCAESLELWICNHKIVVKWLPNFWKGEFNEQHVSMQHIRTYIVATTNI